MTKQLFFSCLASYVTITSSSVVHDFSISRFGLVDQRFHSLMYCAAFEHLYCCGVREPVAIKALVSVHGNYRLHIFFTQLEVPDAVVLNNTFLVYGFRDRNHSALNMPAQYHLSDRFLVFASDRGQDLILEYIFLAFCKRPPCLHLDLIFIHDLFARILLAERVNFYLVDCRDYLVELGQISKPDV